VSSQQQDGRGAGTGVAGRRTDRGEPPPAPPPLTVPVPDSHTHLDVIGGDPDAHLRAARAVGVDRVVQVGVDVASSRWAVDLAARRPEVVATVAIHPNDAPRQPDLDEALRAVERLAAHPRVRGIGETGLDTYRTGPEGRGAQEASFRAHIAIAKRYGKPLVIHDRDAHADVLRVLDEEGAPDTVVMHCFSGDADFAAECLRRGFVLSFSGTVTFRNARDVQAAARTCPVDRMLVETDAPFLTPTPYRGRLNGPYLLPLTVRALADLTGTDLDRLCAAVSATAERVFGRWA
jgi:TatD DNase family protein